MPRQIATLTLADAREIISAGEKKAQEIGIPCNLAVVLGRWRNSDSARTDGRSLVGVIGAVGASGGTVDQDQKVVEAAVAALQKDR